MILFIEVSLNGAIAGSLYALIALAFVVVYKASKIMNFALGELVMFGSSFVAVGMNVFDIGLAFSIGLAFLGMAVVSYPLNRLVLKPVMGGRMVALIMVTIGWARSCEPRADCCLPGCPGP